MWQRDGRQAVELACESHLLWTDLLCVFHPGCELVWSWSILSTHYQLPETQLDGPWINRAGSTRQTVEVEQKTDVQVENKVTKEEFISMFPRAMGKHLRSPIFLPFFLSTSILCTPRTCSTTYATLSPRYFQVPSEEVEMLSSPIRALYTVYRCLLLMWLLVNM